MAKRVGIRRIYWILTEVSLSNTGGFRRAAGNVLLVHAPPAPLEGMRENGKGKNTKEWAWGRRRSGRRRVVVQMVLVYTSRTKLVGHGRVISRWELFAGRFRVVSNSNIRLFFSFKYAITCTYGRKRKIKKRMG